MSNTDEIMTVKDVAVYLKISPLTIYRKRKAGTIRFFKDGRFVRFRKSDIDAYVEQYSQQEEG